MTKKIKFKPLKTEDPIQENWLENCRAGAYQPTR